MENLKTFEEFNWKFWKKRELTPEEEYQKQKRAAEKETEKIKNIANKDYLEEEDEEIPSTSSNYENDPYGEETWTPDEDERIRRENAQKRRENMQKRYYNPRKRKEYFQETKPYNPRKRK